MNEGVMDDLSQTTAFTLGAVFPDDGEISS